MERALQVVAVPACLAAVRAVAPPELSPGSPYEEMFRRKEIQVRAYGITRLQDL